MIDRLLMKWMLWVDMKTLKQSHRAHKAGKMNKQEFIAMAEAAGEKREAFLAQLPPPRQAEYLLRFHTKLEEFKEGAA